MFTRIMRLGIARWNLPRKLLKERKMVYECIVCGTTFKEEDGEHKNGYLVCPSCWSEDLREVKTDERNDNEAK